MTDSSEVHGAREACVKKIMMELVLSSHKLEASALPMFLIYDGIPADMSRAVRSLVKCVCGSFTWSSGSA
jgi:hypothetical protein